jgi:hypothetical protein
MDVAELRAYVLSNTQGNEAFYALADRVYASPQKTLSSPQELEQLPEMQRARQRIIEEKDRQTKHLGSP